MRRKYPSDISREQFQRIQSSLESARKTTRPRRINLYDIFCAILYLLKSGCQWRMLPADFPKWQHVYYYFSVWSEKKEGGTSILEDILKKIRWRGPKEQWSKRTHESLYH